MCNRRTLSLAAMLAAWCLLGAFMEVQASEPGLPKGILVLDGRQAPALTLDNMDGETWNIEDARGHWVFVHFWATWCGPCREEMPTIQAISEKIDSKKLEIALINTAESEDTVFEFLALVAPDITPLMDSDGLVTEKWQPRGLPATFFVDPDGRLQYLALGGRPWDSAEYLAFIQRLTGE